MTEETIDTINAVNAALASGDWTPGEQEIIKWQYGLLDGFRTALWGALVRADPANLSQMARSFPVEVAALLAWRDGDLAQRLREAGIAI